MDVTWIIGNGFDMNLELETGYRSFLEKHYLADKAADSHKDDLVSRIGEAPLAKGTHWSDLEMLLGFATSKYAQNETEEFHNAFEDIQRQFITYVHEQELTLPDKLPEAWLSEFWQSVRRTDKRMVTMDQRRFIFNAETRESIRYRFICLNYTHVFDRFLDEGRALFDSSGTRQIGNSFYEDSVFPVLHLHGEVVEEEGAEEEGDSIVFGVASPQQFTGGSFAQNAEFCDMWVKGNKNSTIYGNDKSTQMSEMIAQSHVILIYGCSFGDSDAYIWQEIGERLRSTVPVNVVLFVHGLPDRHGQQSRLYQRRKNEALMRFAIAAGLSDDELERVRERIIILASSDIFKFNASALAN